MARVTGRPRKLSPEDERHIREIHEWKMAEIKRINDIGSVRALAAKFEVSVRCIEWLLAR